MQERFVLLHGQAMLREQVARVARADGKQAEVGMDQQVGPGRADQEQRHNRLPMRRRDGGPVMFR